MYEPVKGSYTLQFKFLGLGFICAEIFLICKQLIIAFLDSSLTLNRIVIFWFVISAYVVLLGVMFLNKKLRESIKRVLRSKRFDLAISCTFGFSFLIFINGIGISFLEARIEQFRWSLLLLILSIPLVVSLTSWLSAKKVLSKESIKTNSIFISDKEVKSNKDDAFGYSELAKKFGERIYNHGASESLVFGIDAPWGTGKSTFVNLCEEYLLSKYEKNLVTYKFDVIRFEDNEKLLEKFVEGLVKTIRNNFFSPELETLFSKYLKLLNDSKLTFSILGTRFGIPFNDPSIDETLVKIEQILRRIDKKIIVIIDDLDRIDFSSIKNILFAVKKSFSFSNISYVLCYDTANITVMEQSKVDTEKITEFLEKFVNIKISLYLDSNLLLKYFTEQKEISIANNLLSDPKLLSIAMSGLEEMFKSNEYDDYLSFIGDARKLKRLVNTIIMLEVEQTDFFNMDFNKTDLIHLLLLYINYPQIFRKVYNSETMGRRGYFSLVTRFDDNYPEEKEKSRNNNDETEYKNSKLYTTYLSGLTQKQQFLLNKLFSVNDRVNDRKRISQEEFSTLACFNGSKWSSGGRNLERYLNLIVNLRKPVPLEQYKFYLNAKESIFKTSIKEVFSKAPFSFECGEENQEQLWRVLANTSGQEYTAIKAKEVIRYAIDVLPYYSILGVEKSQEGLRQGSLVFIIVNLLDKVGWSDESGNHWRNSGENVVQIAEWIFGEKNFEGKGIIETLASVDRGILGIYDLTNFCLYCCAGRNSDIHNLSRALSIHGGPENPQSGLSTDIIVGEMRELSQKSFETFKKNYIDKSINMLEEIFKLTPKNIYASSYDYFLKKVGEDQLAQLAQSKISSIPLRILHQFGHSKFEHENIFCGYYDVEGSEDKGGIKVELNNYLFNFCFDPQISKHAYSFFVYCLLGSVLDNLRNGYRFELNTFDKFLDLNLLITYWKEYGPNIKSRNFEGRKGLFKAGNFETDLSMTHLNEIYELLDSASTTQNKNLH